MPDQLITISRKGGGPLNEAIKMMTFEHGDLLSALEGLTVEKGRKPFFGGGSEPINKITFSGGAELAARFPPLGLDENIEVHKAIAILNQYATDLVLEHKEVSVAVSDLVGE